MGSLTYSAIASLDGYIEDRDGKFDWAAPGPDLHAFFNELERPIGTYLYGRRMYETMRFWETADDPHPQMRDYTEIWRAADKVVYSRTLEEVSTARTTLEREFDPERVRRLKEERDMSIGGPALAAEALRAGLVDDVHLSLHPIAVGGGKPAFPPDQRMRLQLVDEHHFRGGVIHLHYRVR
jgi:dihydrofolate reductase